MTLFDYFRRRPDGRCEPLADIASIEMDLEARLAARKAARSIKDPHKRGHFIRMLNKRVSL